MQWYSMKNRDSHWPKRLLIFSAVLFLLLVGAVFAVRKVYHDSLQPVSNSQTSILVTVERGFTPHEIAVLLQERGVIRASWAFEWFVRNNGVRDDLKAGTYSLKPSFSVEQVVSVLTRGQIATDLVTILPGHRIDQVRDGLINAGYDPSEVDAALDPSLYKDHPALVDKPADANLEGYIYPESFHKTAETSARDIIELALDELQEQLTPEVRANINRQGLTTHEGIIIASIVEREVSNPEDRPKVAQVFLKRLEVGMALESDATASYGAILDGEDPSLTYRSPYNTYQHTGLTPGPISNVSATSLQAVANPADTDYLFFVSGDDGTTHFSKTLEEHEQLTEKYCTKLCR